MAISGVASNEALREPAVRHPVPPVMRAAIVSPSPGEPAVRAGRWPVPELRPGTVLVQVVRAALNYNDELTLRARADLAGPAVPGSDAAGVVARVAADVRGHSEGDEVVVLPSLGWGPDPEAPLPSFEILGDESAGGAHAEYVVVPAENVFRKPPLFTWDEAAALPLAGVTAWRALVTRGRLAPGQTVVITAASGGVGTFATQIAVALGARVVAITSTGARMQAVRDLGAHVVLSRTGPNHAEELKAAVGAGADLVLDSTGDWDPLLAILRRGGRLVTVGRTNATEAKVTVGRFFWEQQSILGTSMGSPSDFAELLAHVESRPWAPVVDSVFALAEVERAYERLASLDRVGKVVVDPTL
jgi:zinc-binding alcohol dehydrogenase/oxidoreductase